MAPPELTGRFEFLEPETVLLSGVIPRKGSRVTNRTGTRTVPITISKEVARYGQNGPRS